MSYIRNTTAAIDNSKASDLFYLLQDELKQGLMLYWNSANEILGKTSIKLNEPPKDFFSLENNFFSALFLYSYFRAGISKSKRVLFVAVNQCLRGMVTGCDNILDNEYKKTLDTDLPIKAIKFRSVLDIMVSDRILVAILHRGYRDGEFSFDYILKANAESLHALLQSGVQEASEEEGAGDILKPEDVLSKIHPLKTGILFQAPWALPELIEHQKLKSISKIKEGLFQIGMGCQVLDDMVDLSMDTQMNRHNYVASLIFHGENLVERKALEAYSAKNDKDHDDPDFLFNFSDARKASTKKALFLLQKGTKLLFDKEHKFMIDYSIGFVAKRIGAHRFF
ncbi:MAG: polyprenyl synthetase family protein [Desulfobacula sp.]|nr:polyprenyl synthetase family protein [Desulfobacula sp.]